MQLMTSNDPLETFGQDGLNECMRPLAEVHKRWAGLPLKLIADTQVLAAGILHNTNANKG